MTRAALLDRVFSKLIELDCDPRLSPDGRTITATCPCCIEPNGLEMTLPSNEPDTRQ